MPSATSTKTMWSLGVVKSHVKASATTQDGLIARLADGVSSRIESYINRRIVSQTITNLVIDNNDSDKVRLPDYPVISIQSIETRWTMSSAWLALDAGLYELDGRHGFVYAVGFVQGFYTGPRTVRVSYTAGWDVQDGPGIPADLYTMPLDYVKFLYDRWNNDLLVTQSLSEGNRNATVPQELPKDLKDAFAHYVKRRI
jgi:hypothetical protein